MSSNKKAKSKYSFIIICIIGFVVSIFFEFYFINYFPYDYFMLFGTGIIMCIFGYLSIDGVLEIINQTSRKRDEQNEIMIKASKAIYLTTKKIALNSSHSIPDTLETPKDFSSLIDDLSQANERLAKEVENAVSLQSLVQKNRSIVNNAREIIEEREQSLSPLEVEKDLKLDEAISETDFETVTQPETIDSMINHEVAIQEAAIQTADNSAIQKEYQTETPATADILEETIEAVGNIMKETEKTPEPISNQLDSKASELSDTIAAPKTAFNSQTELEEASETISDIFSEVKETASNVLNSFAENNETVANNITEESRNIHSAAIQDDIMAENNDMVQNNIAAENADMVQNSVPTENTAMTQNNITEESSASAENTTMTQNNIAEESSVLVENTDIVQNSVSVENTNMIQNNIAEENSVPTENTTMTQKNIAIKNDIKTENSETANLVSKPEMSSAQNTFSTSPSQKPTSDGAAADKPMTSEEIAALFANL